MKTIETKTNKDHFFELFENGDVKVTYYKGDVSCYKMVKKINKEKINKRMLLKFIHNYNKLSVKEFIKIYKEV